MSGFTVNDKSDKEEKIDKTIDPYTGEEVPVAEDADKFVEVVPRETDNRKGQNYLLEEETSMDALAADENADEVAKLAASYTEDEEIKADFAERQQLAVGGRKVLEEELDEHHSESPKLSAGDLDADWRRANQTGEETVGGSVSTPDQDRVDELGEAVGLTYEDDEPLQGEEKIRERDRNRWELNPESALEDEDKEDEDEMEHPIED
jgi:uncharacterized protein DUF6335